MARRPTPDASIGERIRARRKLLGLSVRHAADRAGIAHSTWSRIETGQNSADNRFTVAAIAEALRCPVADLTGLPATPVDQDQAETRGAIYETMRAVIDGDLRYKPISAEVPPVPVLAREVDLVAELRAKCDYAGAGHRLPDLIRGLHAAAYGPERADALRALVLATDSASFVVRYAGHPASACLVAERAQQAAEALDDAVMLGLAAWAQAHAATGCGLYGRALTIADQAAARLQPRLAEPDAMEMYGALVLTSAFAAYASGRPADGQARLDEAETVAERTGDSAALRLMFGPTNIKFWRIAMETDGGDPGRAVEIAKSTTPTAIPRVARQASYYSDVGRALARVGQDAQAVRMLLTAERLAPQRVRNAPLTVETARALLDRAQRNAVGAELRGLCERIGLTA